MGKTVFMKSLFGKKAKKGAALPANNIGESSSDDIATAVFGEEHSSPSHSSSPAAPQTAAKTTESNTVLKEAESAQSSAASEAKITAAAAASPAKPTKTVRVSTKLETDELPSAVRTSNTAVSIASNEAVFQSYDQIPVLEQTKLPRGGVSVESAAVGRVQFGIPPETIKDSMQMGIPVPQVYIVPVERFCREMGPGLGVNLAEFEFPAYFNFFVYKKKCTLVVDSADAEDNIRRVFSETLLGPAQFRRAGGDSLQYEPEDFAPDFPKAAIPNFQKELEHFRIMPDGKELVLETLLEFRHFEMRSHGHKNLGVPPPLSEEDNIVIPDDTEEDFGSVEDEAIEPEEIPEDESGVETRESKTPWTYCQSRFDGDVATVWPKDTTDEQKKNRSSARLEIFKMPGGTEYILHDVDERNFIIGKARVSGHVKVSELMSVDGFGGHSILDDLKKPQKTKAILPDGTEVSEPSGSDFSQNVDDIFPSVAPPSFHPPSFGVTVLGNSHGFDKSGSVSGYVLWINGRGVMIDPPPYSSATLEREGIRPRMIVGIIITHCHADHDAGAFQKVLTGSPVVVITTPTIYKSFIRKYAALSALSPALLRHSHRYKQAIIGQPLRFQGATFHFTYTLHTIPCVGFRVEWRGRSMVFTGDHFNSPSGMEKLQESGVMTKARVDDLRNLVLQDTDLLLHESGAPPIHTPLDVLLALPKEVKKRLYVVHTSALPDDCELKAAPTGTKGTIRLDQIDSPVSNGSMVNTGLAGQNSSREPQNSFSACEEDYGWSGQNEYGTVRETEESMASQRHNGRPTHSSFANLEIPLSTFSRPTNRQSFFVGTQVPGGIVSVPPPVALRPASSTDAWFILNLLSAVPFLSSLSYTSTMELLETARVDAYRQDDVILTSSRRSSVLCVIWEGTCSERRSASTHSQKPAALEPVEEESSSVAVWHAGDWTGPISLQPERALSGDGPSSSTHDVVAFSSEGVKVITVEFTSLQSILKAGSPLYRKYLEQKNNQERAKMDISANRRDSSGTAKLLENALKDLNILDLLNCNSALRKLNAVQKRHLESLAEGPVIFQPNERLWRAGTTVDRAFIIISGSASFVPRRRNAGSSSAGNLDGCDMHIDARKAMNELGKKNNSGDDDASSMSSVDQDTDSRKALPLNKVLIHGGASDPNNFENLKRGLERRANHANDGSVASISLDGSHDFESVDADIDAVNQLEYKYDDDNGASVKNSNLRNSLVRRRSSHARKANKVLGRLYNRRAFTGGLVFSRGHFLGDVSKMVAGLHSASNSLEPLEAGNDDSPAYGFGDQIEGGLDDIACGPGSSSTDNLTAQIIHEEGNNNVQIHHSSTLTAGAEGCVVLIFPKQNILPFLDMYPGLLLSLLGTQVVV